LRHTAYVDVDRHDVQNKHLAIVLPGDLRGKFKSFQELWSKSTGTRIDLKGKAISVLRPTEL